jgi:hypothetical protein
VQSKRHEDDDAMRAMKKLEELVQDAKMADDISNAQHVWLNDASTAIRKAHGAAERALSDNVAAAEADYQASRIKRADEAIGVSQ